MKNTSKPSFRRRKFRLLDNTDSALPSGNITFLIAFIIPVVIFAALYYVRNIYPFGTNCYLRSDMYHQYAPFFSELWHKIRSGEALTYSWDIGMGTNFVSLFAYYLASPVNWLIALFPQKYMIEIMNVLIILKIAGASVTMSYYISKHFHTKKCTVALFGIFYALSGYVAAYSWNIMWLDCILLLPLIMLGLERLVKENKGFLYCISLGLCIFTNYYIAIMICMSVVLYFIVLMIAYDGGRKPILYLKKTLKWIFYSLLAGGLAACLLLPELYTFSLSASSSISFPKTLTAYFSVMEMIVRQLMNVPVHLGLEHYPNIYCGVAVFLLIPLYIMDKKIQMREKIGKCVLLTIFLLAFNLNTLNFIWHGLHFPNSLPCRQAFIYIFFLLTMSYEAFHHIKSVSRRQFAGAVWIAAAFLIIAEQLFTGSEVYDFKIFYISGAFLLIYALLMLLHRTTSWKVPVVLFLTFAVAIIECTINLEATGIGTTSRSAYLLDYNAVDTVTETVYNEDDSFYRMDKITGARSKNDGAWHNYHTISTFSSTANAGMSDLFGLLGLEHSTNAYGYDGSTMVTNALFSVKYLISNKFLAEDSLRTYDTGYDGEFIYRNHYTLPVGYAVPADVKYSWQPSSMYNGIENQNSLIRLMTGVHDVFTLTYTYHTDSDVTFNPVKNGHMYLVVRNSLIDSVGVSINGSVTNYTGLKNGNHVLDIGYVTTEDSVEAYADSSMDLLVYTLETDRFQTAFNHLNRQGLQVTDWSDTRIKGTVSADADGTMLFSIPYDGGWSVYIDGHKTETYAVQNALLGVDITAGNHTVTLKYMPVHFILGCVITLLCILILIAIYLCKRRLRAGKWTLKRLPLFVQTLLSEDDGMDKPDLSGRAASLMDKMNDFDTIELDEDTDLSEDADQDSTVKPSATAAGQPQKKNRNGGLK